MIRHCRATVLDSRSGSFGAYCVHESETGADECAQVSARGWTPEKKQTTTTTKHGLSPCRVQESNPLPLALQFSALANQPGTPVNLESNFATLFSVMPSPFYRRVCSIAYTLCFHPRGSVATCYVAIMPRVFPPLLVVTNLRTKEARTTVDNS